MEVIKMSYEKKVKLKDLYESSLNKWTKILQVFDGKIDHFANDNHFYVFYNSYCMSMCSFCLDADGGCGRCLINHSICDMNSNEGLIDEGNTIYDRDVFREWLVKMVNALEDMYNRLGGNITKWI